MHRLASRSLLSIWLVFLFVATVFVTSALAKPRTKKPAPAGIVKACGVILDPFYNPPVSLTILDVGPPILYADADFRCDAGQTSLCGLETEITVNDVEITYKTILGKCGNRLTDHQQIDMSGFPKGSWLCRYQVWDAYKGNKLWPDQFVLYVVQ